LHVVDQAIDKQKEAATGDSHVNIFMAAALVVAGVLTFRLFAPRLAAVLNQRFDPWAARNAPADAAAEQKAFSKFAEKFTAGPNVPERTVSGSAPAHEPQPATKEESPKRATDPLREFLRTVPKELAAMRSTVSELNTALDAASRRKTLADFSRELLVVKNKSQLPALLPFWQTASALEGLLDQLAKKPDDITPSALRTVASALDLLKALCVPGLKPDLASAPPVRILAVDDDPICRYAISFALKKVLGAPDVAGDGKAALALAGGLAYDVVFLDVEMPGMDGFELCSRIHATDPNRTTPVVFVTRHSDFDSRAKSSLSGGRDLIGKPFLTFEVAVKALTMVLQRRLQSEACERMGLSKVSTPSASDPPSEALPVAQAVPAG
jgi:CheY-like chemotaxis protein